MTNINQIKNSKLKILLQQMQLENKEFQEILNRMFADDIDESRFEVLQNIFLIYWRSWKLFQTAIATQSTTCQQAISGYRIILKYQRGQFFLELTRCEHNFDINELLENNYLISDFNINLKDPKLKEMIEKKYRNHFLDKQIHEYLKWLTQLWSTKNPPTSFWAVVSGNTNTGKTLFTVLGTNTYIKKTHKKVIFISANNLFIKFNFYKFSDKLGLMNLYNMFKKIPLLVIDNFGLETQDLMFRDEFLSEIFNFRRNHNLPTILISNFSFDDLKKRYTYAKTNTEKVKVQALFDKFATATSFFTFNKKII